MDILSQITIGGDLSYEHFADLVFAVHDSGVSPYWNGPWFYAHQCAERILNIAQRPEPLVLRDIQRRIFAEPSLEVPERPDDRGHFPDNIRSIELLCEELGLTYHRCRDGFSEYDEYLGYHYRPGESSDNLYVPGYANWRSFHTGWRPGMTAPVLLDGTIATGPSIPLAQLREGRDTLDTVLAEHAVLLDPVPPLRLTPAVDLPNVDKDAIADWRRLRRRSTNDWLLQNQKDCEVVRSPGVGAMSDDLQLGIRHALHEISRDYEHDPDGEHDRGRFEVGRHAFVWTFEHYDPTCVLSGRPSSALVKPALKIMLEDEC